MRLPTRLNAIHEFLARKQIYSAIDRGVNYIDTAYTYHGGKSESFLGEVLSADGFRNKVKLATKLPHWATSSRQDMEKMLDLQLRKLRTDRIDYYLVHNLHGGSWETAKQNGVVEFLDAALKAGKIRNAGFSFHGAANEFRQIVDDYDWTFCQIQYNFLDTMNQAGTAGLKYAAERQLAVMIMEPLRGGNLAKTPPPEVSHIWNAAETKRTPAAWSLCWIWNHPEATVVLSGMNNDMHINENIALAHDVEANSLTVKEMEIVEKAAIEFRKAMKIGCTGCQYCMPCPAGVDIPGCFDSYNSYRTFRDRSAKLMYTAFKGGVMSGKPSLASQCVECGKCLEKCPQGLQIPDLLKTVKEDMEGLMTRPMLWLIKRVLKVSRKQA